MRAMRIVLVLIHPRILPYRVSAPGEDHVDFRLPITRPVMASMSTALGVRVPRLPRTVTVTVLAPGRCYQARLVSAGGLQQFAISQALPSPWSV
jgi:hypothetical protein